MGRRVTVELSCDCCGKEYPPHMEYGNIGYIAHRNICEPYNMSCFVVGFNKETNDDKKWEEVLDHLNILYDDGKFKTYEFVMDAFKCMVRSLRIGMIEYDEDDTGWKAYPEIADFMEARVDLIKDIFNAIIDKRINDIEKEANRSIDSLRSFRV